MSDPAPVRFGAFELDLCTGELRKHGIRLKLQDQPFQVLRALVERPGGLVTREEIQRRIWADGTFVDFDQSLNRAVNKVREALGDAAENPRYIETLARRGYRFIAPVEGPPPAAVPQPPPAAALPRRKPAWMVLALGTTAITAVGIWLASRDSLPPPRLVRLTALTGSAYRPSFSPDGTQIAFVWSGEKKDNYDIYVKMLGNPAALRLTSNPAFDSGAAWSPNGRQVAFVSSRGQGGIYVISALGGPERKLADLVPGSFPSWSSDGKFLAVTYAYGEKSNDPNNGALLLVPVEGGGEPRRILTPQPAHWYQEAIFSPEARRLAVLSCTGAPHTAVPSCQLEILALNADLLPRGIPRVVATPVFRPNGTTWSGDGNSLVVSATGIGSSSVYPEHYLWRIPVNGTGEPRRLEVAGAETYWPAIDARCHRLAFARGPLRTGTWQWTQGGELPFVEGFDIRNPQFSHDGKRVAFLSTRSGDEMDVWVANADGTGWAQITSGISHDCGTPRWSPDDRYIAFDAWGKNGRWNTWVVDATGGRARSLTHGPDDNNIPSWSSDGKWIYFCSNPVGRVEIWRLPAQGGRAEQVTKKGGFVAFESPDGKTLYYTKSGIGVEGLFAIPLPSGEEKQVFQDRVSARGFAVFSDGIYYITYTAQKPNFEIRFHEFASGRSRKIAEIEGPLNVGFTVSPDRKKFLYSKVVQAADLWMIENFQ